jgi:hypothetical protein
MSGITDAKSAQRDLEKKLSKFGYNVAGNELSVFICVVAELLCTLVDMPSTQRPL